MTSLRAYFVFSLLYLLPLYAKDIDLNEGASSTLATTEGLPSNLVDQRVCVISGDFVDQSVDVVLSGPETMVIQRNYSNLDPRGNFGRGWSINHRGATNNYQGPYEGVTHLCFLLMQPSSARLNYICPREKGDTEKRELHFKPLIPKGYTHGGKGLTGRDFLPNQQVLFYPKEDKIVVKTSMGSKRIFFEEKRDEEGYAICYEKEERKRNQSRYVYDNQKNFPIPVESILCEHKNNHLFYSSIEFKKPSGKIEEHPHLTLFASDGKKVRYSYLAEKVKGEYHYYLKRVEKDHAPEEIYHYSYQYPGSSFRHLSKKSLPDGRFVKVDYYHPGTNAFPTSMDIVFPTYKGEKIYLEDKDDFRLNRVKCLLEPVGTDQTPIITRRFIYHVKKKEKKGKKELLNGYTEVFDAYDNKTTYHFDKEHRLKDVKKYNSQGDVYCSESYTWKENGCLESRSLRDGNHHRYMFRTFEYDERGNLLSTTLHGRLSGHSPHYEEEKTSYTYTDDGLNLLKSETNSRGVTILYDYLPKTDLVTAKLTIFNHEIKKREFFVYDRHQILIRKIVDDGNQVSKDDLSHVTERHITHFYVRLEPPVGLPDRIQERYINFKGDGKETVLRTTTCEYTRDGKLLRQEVFDSQGAYCYTLFFEYDAHGNVTKEVNALGEVITKEYDANNNLILQRGPRQDYYILNTYDFMNRLIKQEEIHDDGRHLSTTHHYNYLSQKIATINPQGLETRYEYDEWGHLVAEYAPPVPDATGTLIYPVARKEYNIAGYPTALVDPKGRRTSIDYNIRGKPVHISYPDGSEERFYYEADGTLCEQISKEGLSTRYVRDYQGRIIKEFLVAPNGVVLKIKEWTYNAFHLLSFQDVDGTLTSYNYNSAGQLIEERVGERLKRYEYDTWGRVQKVLEWYGEEPDAYRISIKLYDALDRVIEEQITGADGTLFHFQCFAYDHKGNKTLVQEDDQIILIENNKITHLPILLKSVK